MGPGLRILLASYSSQKTRGGWFYGTAQKLQNGFIRLGAGVEFFSDRDVARAASPLRSRILGKRACNSIFLDYVAHYQPHLIVLCHADLIDNQTLQIVRDRHPHKKIVEVRVDALHNPPTLPHMRARLPFIDRSFVTTAGPALNLVSSAKAPACFMPNPVDSGIETGLAHRSDALPYDAIYSRRPVISMPANDYRTEVVEAIEANKALKVYSIGIHGGSQIFGQAYFDLLGQAAIGLNLSAMAKSSIEGQREAALMRLYSSDRIAHYGGNGLLVLNHTIFGLGEIMKEGKEFIAFSRPEEARETVAWLSSHPHERRMIAAAGHSAFHVRFSSQAVAAYILAKAFRNGPSQADWPDDDYFGI